MEVIFVRKPGPNTPGEEVGRCTVHRCSLIMCVTEMGNWTPWCICANTYSMHAVAKFIDVFMTHVRRVSHHIQNVTGGRLSSKEHLDTLSKEQSKPNTPQSWLFLHLRFCVFGAVKRWSLEACRKDTKLQSAHLSLFLWNVCRGLSCSTCRSEVWPRVCCTVCLRTL